MNKHAYLIMAHNNFYVLEKLIRLLDDNKNDIYIHIDKKVKNFNFQYYKDILRYSNIIFIDRINVGWGAFSGIRAELNLYKAAVTKGYMYYHLISGVDLPIKSQYYIHKFFEEHEGMEFLTYLKPEFAQKQKIIERVNKFYFLQQFGRNSNIAKVVNNLLIKIQERIKIKRYNNEFPICYGANWCSLTHEAVKCIISKEKWIIKTFKYTQCCDEVYKQTILVNIPRFKEKLYRYKYNEAHISYNMRHVDWKRGGPYIFKSSDYKELIDMPSLFARKFDENVDKKIIDMIYERLK